MKDNKSSPVCQVKYTICPLYVFLRYTESLKLTVLNQVEALKYLAALTAKGGIVHIDLLFLPSRMLL